KRVYLPAGGRHLHDGPGRGLESAGWSGCRPVAAGLAGDAPPLSLACGGGSEWGSLRVTRYPGEPPRRQRAYRRTDNRKMQGEVTCSPWLRGDGRLACRHGGRLLPLDALESHLAGIL